MVWRSGLEVGVGEAVVQQLLLAHVRVLLRPFQAFLEVAEDLRNVVGVCEDCLLTDLLHHWLPHFSGNLRLGLNFRLRLALRLCFRLGLFSPLVSWAAPAAFASLSEHLSERMRSSRALIPQESFNKVDSVLNHSIKSRRNVDLLSVDLNRSVVLVVDHGEDLQGSLLQGLNLEERVLVLHSSLAVGAEVKVRANCAFVTDANDALLPAAVAVDVLMNNNGRFS